MRLRKSVVYHNRYINCKTNNSIGKCTNQIRYWYYDINTMFVKKDSFKNKYYL